MKKMRKICQILKGNNHGDMGIGAMIVFIAMVLVAGIAASVLIQTANRLEIQAMTTGQETTDEVATGIGIEDVSGRVADANISGTWFNDTIHNITICVSPRSGSKDLDLGKCVIEISNSSIKCVLHYDSTNYNATVHTSGVYSTPVFDLAANHFGVIKLEDADGSMSAATPVINRGDHALLTISTAACFTGVDQRCDVWGIVIPENGAPGIYAFRTPASYSDVVYDLY
jgi:archaeal flagellin FlaB